MALASKKMFESYKTDLGKKMESGHEEDPRIISFKPDKTFRARLLYYLDDAMPDRTGPFIDKYIHSVFDKVEKKTNSVTCPTSLYLSGKQGFSMCPICANNTKLWDDHKTNGSFTSKELYDRFKRKFYGFALVYVVNDPVNKENNGTVKIMKYGATIMEFLQKEIFDNDVKKGRKRGEEETDKNKDIVGNMAFDLDSGYDLIVEVVKNVTTEGTLNKYLPKFAREKTSVNVDRDKLEAMIKALNFDKDFYSKSSAEQLMKFYQDEVLDATPEASTEATDGVVDDLIDKLPPGTENTVADTGAKTDDAKEQGSSGDVDIDALIAGIDKEIS